MLPLYNNYFIGKVNNCLKIEHDKVNNIPFELDLQSLGTTGEIWENDMHLDTPKHKVQVVHSIQYYTVDYGSFPLHSLKSE